MATLKAQITQFKDDFFAELNQVQTEQALEEVRIKYLGRKGLITDLMEALKQLSLEQKRQIGPLLNELKATCQEAFEKKKNRIHQEQQQQQQAKQKFFDVSAYKPHTPSGSLHPLTLVRDHVEHVFTSMGFKIATGPEVETDYYNFEALNIPSDHPARDMFDTFWLDVPNLLLRTHTSPVQIHELEQQDLPLAVLAPGRCYRHEATDASHDFVFMQAEGLLVQEHVNLSHLLATVRAFMQELFEKETLETRVRPSYFPFVEPGIEIDVECPLCNHGCSVCKETEWIEMGGAGLIHPEVLTACNINADHYAGFAFGFGLTRLTMLKYGINDIRLLHTNNMDFLKQF